ncbi:MAG: TerB family tellurite resistance protein [candidate division Zixibacteria bacterium]|nr:TerB family tellurite resistance protein [candidate division Zixibacteria bacterium]
MLSKLKDLLTTKTDSSSPVKQPAFGINRVAVATAVICLEMAHADNEFTEEEQHHIPEILNEIFEIPIDDANDIIKSAENELKNSLDLWQFTNIINQNFDKKQKMEVIYSVWKLVYSDGTLDKHEDYLMHKLSNLLNLTHNDLIEAKLKAHRNSKH